jgi:hypothetical protein
MLEDIREIAGVKGVAIVHAASISGAARRLSRSIAEGRVT